VYLHGRGYRSAGQGGTTAFLFGAHNLAERGDNVGFYATIAGGQLPCCHVSGRDFGYLVL